MSSIIKETVKMFNYSNSSAGGSRLGIWIERYKRIWKTSILFSVIFILVWIAVISFIILAAVFIFILN